MPYAAIPVLRLPTPLHLLNMVQCWGVACLVLLLLSVVLAYMEVVVVLCLASLGCVSEPYALQSVGELLWWYVSVKHGLD